MKIMKFIILFTVVWVCPCFGQKDSTAIFELSKGRLSYPLANFSKISNGSVEEKNKHPFFHPIPPIRFLTNGPDSVNAVYPGKVCYVGNIQGSHFIIIRFEDYFITYTGLNSPFVVKGDFVKKGEIIATVFKDDDSTYMIELIISKKSKFLNPDVWFNPDRRA